MLQGRFLRSAHHKLLWVPDVIFKEYEARIRRANSAEVMNNLRKITFNLLKQTNLKRKLAILDDKF